MKRASFACGKHANFEPARVNTFSSHSTIPPMHAFFRLRALISNPLHSYSRSRDWFWFSLLLLITVESVSLFLSLFLISQWLFFPLQTRYASLVLSLTVILPGTLCNDIWHVLTFSFFLLSFSNSYDSYSLRWSARGSLVAFSAFLSTENVLHHNLRPNIGGHTSRHNNRVPSEILNGQDGGGRDVSRRKGMGMVKWEIRLKIVEERAGRERKREREKEKRKTSAMGRRICHNNNNINNSNNSMITIRK